MKKRYIVGIVVAVLILVSILTFVIYNIIMKNGKKYEITEVKQYNYFILKQNDLTRSN